VSTRSLHLLVFEADERLCLLLVRRLEVLGAAVSGATSLEDAVRDARRIHPNVILCDVLPDAGGTNAIRQLRIAAPATRVLVHRANLRPGDREVFLAAGAADCLMKGLRIRELYEWIRVTADR
jgi:DNA-binding response OmpR family regulator